MPNAINSRALTGKSRVLTMISRAVDVQKMNFQYIRTGATKIIPAKQPCLSIFYHSAAVLQQIGGVLPKFYDVIYLSTLTSSCRETDVKEIWFLQILWCQLSIVLNVRKKTAFGSQELQDDKGMY